MSARVRRQSSAAMAERPLLVFDFQGRPVQPRAEAPTVQHPPQSIREAVLAWLDAQM
jgi:hypothetical protein